MGIRASKYACFEFTEEKLSIASCLGFNEFYSLDYKIRAEDTVLYIGEFDLNRLQTLPPCRIIIIETSPCAYSPLIPHRTTNGNTSEVKCLRIRSDYPDFIPLLCRALQEFQINGSSLGRLNDLLNSTILSYTFNIKENRDIRTSPALYMETNSVDMFSYII
jgi:hypothetical protein